MVQTSKFHPAQPPSDIGQRKLPIIEIQVPLKRIFLLDHKSSRGKSGILYFAKGASQRFDDIEKVFGVCYFGVDDHVCFIETFGQKRLREVDRAILASRGIATISCLRKLKLVDITAEGAAWIGAAGDVSAGDHAVSQLWSRSFYQHRQKPDGIYYRARHDLSRFAIALFDRAKDKVAVVEHTGLLESSYLPTLVEIIDHYRFALLPS